MDDLETAERLANEPGVNPFARQTIRDLVAEVRGLRKKNIALAEEWRHTENGLVGQLSDYKALASKVQKERDEARRQLADLNASYKTMGEYYEANLAEAETLLEANYAEYAALREVERAVRRESSLHGNGCASETGSLKCDCGRGETIAALAAVDALRSKQ